MKDRQLLREMVEDNCPKKPGAYCFLEELVLHSPGMVEYIVLQVKMMEKLKYVWNRPYTTEMSWDDAMMRYVDEGYAAKYCDLYKDPTLRHVNEMYTELVKFKDPVTNLRRAD